MHRGIAAVLLPVALGAAALLGVAQTRTFPGPPTDTNPRANTPNDPDFDKAEPDDEDGDFVPGTSVFEEDNRLFGFAPASTSMTARYLDPSNPRFGQGQISGVSADLAWKLSIGDQRVGVTICDTGIRWDREELRRRIRLNTGELPVPCGVTAGQKGRPLAEYDCDGDGMFTPDDYAGIVQPNEGAHGNPTKLDGEDGLVHFSDGVDEDGNGFVDDIAGWDFFDDDNDPFDASSYSSAGNHGSGRASDAVAEANNRLSSLGLCPRCRLVPIRIWDTFVADTNNFALCILYAADNGIDVIEAAIGALTTTEFSQAATQYAYEHGVALMEVSSDLNTADHNNPTNFNNTIFVKGTVSDYEGSDSVTSQPQPPIGTWFRDSNVTQYGGHAHIAMKGTTGSECTGQAAGAAGLLMACAHKRATDRTPPRPRRRHAAAPPGDALRESPSGASHGRVPARHGFLRAAVGASRARPGERAVEPVRVHGATARHRRRRRDQRRRGPQGLLRPPRSDEARRLAEDDRRQRRRPQRRRRRAAAAHGRSRRRQRHGDRASDGGGTDLCMARRRLGPAGLPDHDAGQTQRRDAPRRAGLHERRDHAAVVDDDVAPGDRRPRSRRLSGDRLRQPRRRRLRVPPRRHARRRLPGPRRSGVLRRPAAHEDEPREDRHLRLAGARRPERRRRSRHRGRRPRSTSLRLGSARESASRLSGPGAGSGAGRKPDAGRHGDHQHADRRRPRPGRPARDHHLDERGLRRDRRGESVLPARPSPADVHPRPQ